MSLSLLLYVITLLTIPFVAYTTYHLLKWTKNFKMWEKKIKEDDSQTVFEDDDAVPDEHLIENFKLIPITNLDEEVDLYSVVTPQKLLVFLDKSCAFCNGNFEDFIAMHIERGFDLKNMIVFFEYPQLQTALDFHNLYDSNFSIFLTKDEKFRQSFDAPFLPIYAQIDENHFLKLRTPSPVYALYNAI